MSKATLLEFNIISLGLCVTTKNIKSCLEKIRRNKYYLHYQSKDLIGGDNGFKFMYEKLDMLVLDTFEKWCSYYDNGKLFDDKYKSERPVNNPLCLKQAKKFYEDGNIDVILVVKPIGYLGIKYTRDCGLSNRGTLSECHKFKYDNINKRIFNSSLEYNLE
jgi:hypothetical protein